MKSFAVLCAVTLVLASLPAALTACPSGSLTSSNGQVCCPSSCGSCGGTGCGSRTGGGSNCCVSGILSSGTLCGSAPCINVDDDYCSDKGGIMSSNGAVCCDSDCGSCGGVGCSGRTGGGDSCCVSGVQSSQSSCASSNAPCWIEGGSTSPTTSPGTGDAPSDVYDLSSWKLTLPVNKDSYFGSGGDGAAEIEMDKCDDDFSGPGLDDGYEDSDYFYLASDGAMVFRTPLVGGSTTPNSDYVRTELRELYNANCDTDSANWSPSGTHVLRGDVKVTQVYSGDPQTIVGQIHAKDSSKALLKLQYDGPSDDIRAIINEDPDDGNPFSINFGLTPGTNRFQYVITLQNSKMTIAVTYGGSTVTESVTFGSGDMSDDWNDHTFYFKAGSYPQADADSGGAFVAQFYNLQLSHS